MKITLSETEQFTCHLAAVVLAYKNPEYNKPGYWHYPQNKNLHEWLANDAESLGAEWALAKYFNLDFDPFLQKGKRIADVGKLLEVKWTPYADGQLIITERDKTEHVGVLVTGKSPDYSIKGWIPLAMAKKPRYRHSKQPNWWVTQINLQPIENLRRSSYGQSAI